MGAAEVKSSRRKKSTPRQPPSTLRSSPPSAAVDGESPAVDGAQQPPRGKAVGTGRAMPGDMSKSTQKNPEPGSRWMRNGAMVPKAQREDSE